MKITNRKAVRIRKRIFFSVSAIIALVTLALFLFDDHHIKGILGVGVFSIWYLYFHVADFQYIEFLDENDKITLRYYKAISFGKQSFSEIEFPQSLLKNAYFENSLFGKMSDLTFVVNTRRGVAEYPSVSLSAVPLKDRRRIQESINEIMGM
jgi:hypothetical protein